VSGFLLILAMGLTAWYAWPAATTFPTRVWTITFAVFLAPFSWPWLIARGHRARKAARTAAARQAADEATALRNQNVIWWMNEFNLANIAGDTARREIAHDVLTAMGANPPGPRTS
jgi:hypothetical protein